MHSCVISTMFGWCFWFFKKTFLFKQLLVPPPPRPGPSHFPLRFFTSSTALPGPSHFPLRFFNPSSPPRPVLCISHSGSLTHRSPPAGPSHFPLQFFNPSIPPPGPSHFPLQFFNLSVSVLENPKGTKEPSVPFISTTLPSWWFWWKNYHFVGRFFDFVTILRPTTMYQDYFNCPWPLSVWRYPLPPSLPRSLQDSENPPL